MKPQILLLTLALGLSACGGDEEPAAQPIVIAPSEGGEETAAPDEPAPSAEGELVISDDACETDADCVPAACCHAAACVAAGNAPDCADVMCTADCQYGTMDCGGGCLCHEGRCAARLSEAPSPPAP